MDSSKNQALNQLRHHCTKLQPLCELSGWTVHTSKHGAHCLHEASNIKFLTLGAAQVAVHAFHQISGTTAAAADDDEEVLSIASGLDRVCLQLHRHMDTLQSYSRHDLPDGAAEACKALQPSILDMYDVCSYVHVSQNRMILKSEDTLLQRATKLRCQLLLATCAVFTQKLLHQSSYTSGYRQHCMYTLLQELKRTGPDNPALGMLVEPLLPRAWRKELDQQKLLKGDEDTDLYSTAVTHKDMQGALKEEGDTVEDGFVLIEAPGLAKLTGKVQKISDALDLIPLYNRKGVELSVTHAVSEGVGCIHKVCCRL